ncbi:MAG: hypothetical protein ACOYPS_03865 [Phycisphaerales bacterium]
MTASSSSSDSCGSRPQGDATPTPAPTPASQPQPPAQPPTQSGPPPASDQHLRNLLLQMFSRTDLPFAQDPPPGPDKKRSPES